MSTRSDRRNAETFERRVREHRGAGMSVSAIAKATGKSQLHTSRIAARVDAEVDADETNHGPCAQGDEE